MSYAARLTTHYWLPLSLALLAAITVLSLMAVPGGEGGVVARTDKLQHLVAYGALAFPVAFARPRGWPWALAVFAVWSGAIELIQPFVGRGMHLSDLMANICGLLLGTAAALALRRLTRLVEAG